jgi:hypothetical protein
MPSPHPIRYLPLHLLIDRDGETSRFSARILPPAPALTIFPNRQFPLKLRAPFPEEVTDLVEMIETALKNGDTGGDGPLFPKIEHCGTWLGEALTDVDRLLYTSLHESLNIHTKNRSLGALVLLNFGDQAAELSELVWESWKCNLIEGSPFLLDCPWISLARFVPSPGGGIDGREEGSHPLKVLVVTSSFRVDGTYDDILGEYIRRDIDSLRQSLDELIREGVFATPTFLPDPTIDELQAALRDADIFHHFGHGGGERDGKAFLMLRDEHRAHGKKVFWQKLRNCFDPYNAPCLKLAVLNACKLQRAGLGTQMARLGVPAVIVMQAEIDAKVIADRGFTQSFYTRLAAGDPIHAAFSKARSDISSRYNCIEAFVPVLILSSLDEAVFHHPNLAKAQHVAERRERQQDPFKQRWDEAVLLEERGQVEAALDRFRALQKLRSDYPGVQDRIDSLDGQVERQRRVHSLVEQLQRAVSESNYGRLQDLLRDTSPLAQEATLAAALERWTHELVERLEQLRREAKWLEARRVLLPLQTLAAQLPAERRPELPADQVESQARQELARRREALQQMWRRRQFVDLIEPARQYLEWDPENREVRQWLREAQEIAQLAEQLKIDDQQPPATVSYTELQRLFENGDWQQVAELGQRLMEQLPAAHRDELTRLMLSATAQQQRSLGDWATVKEVSREMLRLDPEDPEAGALLQEALRNEAESFCRARRWEEAEANCRELLQRTPDDGRAWDLLSKILLGQAEGARRRHDWERVLEVSQCILRDSNLKGINEKARKLKEEADEALRLLKRIRVL